MSIASAAILASAVRPKSMKPSQTSQTFAQSVATRPIQYLLVVGAIVYFGGKFLKGVIPTGANIRKGEAETTTSTDNPFSFKTFLGQKIPTGTNLLKAASSQKEAKKIYDALNTYFADDADIVVGVFSALPSKVQVAQVAESFFNYYKRDILEYIKSGKKTFDFGTGGLSSELYNRIIENVKRKPKF